MHRDLEYVAGGHERQRLDLYLPDRPAGPRPVVVWLHGGAWLGGSKADTGPALRLVGRGYAVASVGYRLSPHARFPAQIGDVKAAVRWLRANAGRYRLDPARVAAGGESAGGHLAALLGTAGGVSEWEGVGGHPDRSSRVQAVVDWYGPADLTRMGGTHDRPDSPEARLLGGPVPENRDMAARASPVTHVSTDAPPFLVLHGDRDEVVPFGQSELLAAALRAAGADVTFHPLKGAGHGGPAFFGAETWQQVEDFLARHLRP